ncbi:hypothetical protein DVH24_030382 [Malus domestica]|uniref:Uncharacterized protein n=1 Tax=Malus domestica TaxID=3750 RepID=A0A498KA50_MALDO|nr:hypothetical protein DVH24_030382 [Malus domestica]
MKVASTRKSKNSGFRGIKDQDEYKKYYEEKVNELMKKRGRKTAEGVNMRPSFSSPFSWLNLLIEFKNMIHYLRVQKNIFATDLNTHHDRFSMQENRVVDKKFLCEQYDQGLKLSGSLEVKVIDHSLKVHDKLGFTKWKGEKKE